MDRSKIGKIYISTAFIQKNSNALPDIFYRLGFIPVRAETMFHNGEIEYIGYSPFFDSITEGQTAPVYVINITCDDTDHITNVSVEKDVNS